MEANINAIKAKELLFSSSEQVDSSTAAFSIDLGEISKLKMIDLMAVEDIQSLQDTFALATNTRARILDSAGVPITKTSNMYRVCCSGEEAVDANCPKGKTFFALDPNQSSCPNMASQELSAPIKVGEKSLGTLILGQYICKTISQEDAEEMSKGCRLNADEFYKLYGHVPSIKTEDISHLKGIIPLLAKHLSDVCYKNYLAKKAESQRIKALDLMETMLNSGDVLLAVVNPKNYEFDFISQAMEEAFDISEGKKCYEALYGRKSPCKACSLSQDFKPRAGETIAPSAQVKEVTNSRTGKEYQITDRMFIWHTGDIKHLITAVDVSERKELMRSKLIDTERRNFFSSLSHELRTPLNGVLGMAHLALKTEDYLKQRDYLEKISSSAGLLLGIINKALDFSKIEAGKLELAHAPFSLRKDVFEPIKNLFFSEVERKKVFLIFDIKEEVPDRFIGDSLRISQIFINLIGNALKFTNHGGITVSLEVTSSSPTEKNFQKGSIHLKATVVDTGIGISEGQLSHLFVPFKQADFTITKKYGGSGLGLAISRELATKMGGSVTVTSTLGLGSTFFIDLTLQKDTTIYSKSCEHVEGGSSAFLENCHILVVEDNLINQEIAIELLTDFGATVDIAENGKLGVDAHCKNKYDLIFMDMLMPVMNGLEATMAIRAMNDEKSKIPIIAMTANAMIDDQKECLKSGMNSHIAKPVIVDNLISVLKRWLPGSCIKRTI